MTWKLFATPQKMIKLWKKWPIKMSVRLSVLVSFGRSVPPEFLRSFLMRTTPFSLPVWGLFPEITVYSRPPFWAKLLTKVRMAQVVRIFNLWRFLRIFFDQQHSWGLRDGFEEGLMLSSVDLRTNRICGNAEISLFASKTQFKVVLEKMLQKSQHTHFEEKLECKC